MRTWRLLLVAVLLVLPSALSGQRSWFIEQFHTDLDVRQNGDVEVTESIRFRFNGSWNGIYRDLRLTPPDVYGRRDLFDVDLVSITDDAGRPLRFESSRQGARTQRWQVWIPGAQDASRTVVIRYVVHNALGFFGEPGQPNYLDEMYWNVTGTEWEVRIERASARINLPAGLEPTESAGYTGGEGSTEQAVGIETIGGSVAFTATRPLGPGENLTAATSWPGGSVTRTAQPSALSRGLSSAWPVIIPFLVFGFAFREWRRKGADPEALPIAVRYEPPDDLSPAEIGTLVDHRAEMHDITATLVDLAVRGYLHIEMQEKKVLGLFSTKEYVFHLKRAREDWTDLSGHEREYLDALFKHSGSSAGGFLSAVLGSSEPMTMDGAGEGPTYGSVGLSDLKDRFYKDLSDIRKAIYGQLISKGHYRRNPSTVKAVWSIGGLALLGLSVAAAGWAAANVLLFVDPVVLGVAGGVSGLIVLVFAQIMPARTLRGARAREKALGFKEFLDRVEEDRFKRMIKSPEQFEQFLPFAMAFKVEKRWAKAFEDMYREPPRWYTGYDGGTFHASSFANDISAMSTAASSAMSSSPSGSSGGGSSGGGGGGGGGGAF